MSHDRAGPLPARAAGAGEAPGGGRPGAGGRGTRETVPGHTPDEHAAAYAELVRAGYVRLGTVAFAGDATVQCYDLTDKARRLLG